MLGRDVDLVALCRLCGFGSVDEALDHVEQTVPAGLLQPKTQFLLRGLLQEPPSAE